MFLQRRSQFDKSEKWAYFVSWCVVGGPSFLRGTTRGLLYGISVEWQQTVIPWGSGMQSASRLPVILLMLSRKLFLIGASLSESHSLVAHRAQAQCIMVRSFVRSFVVRTYTELFVQWFKSYRLFASHRLFWELSVFIQWFTVNFTGLSPLTGWQFFMRHAMKYILHAK
jgi:hypothetical protein